MTINSENENIPQKIISDDLYGEVFNDELFGYYSFDGVPCIDNKKGRLIRNDPTKHYPNKNEASLLRKLMTENGLNEKEVRDIKKYRIMLSEAQKVGEKKLNDDTVKWFRGRIKMACKKTGLVPQHPETIKALDVILNSYYSFHTPYFAYNRPAAKTVVKYYAKK